MLPPSRDMDRRGPVWGGLSELFLDTELGEADLRRIAGVLVRSGYTDRELGDILFGEVFPVCVGNMRSVAGEWAGFDADWLRGRIVGNERTFWTRWGWWRWWRFGRGMIRADWEKVMGYVREMGRGSA